MIASLDSANPPTAAAVAAAKAAGIGMWCVYISTKPNVGLLRPWSDAEIEAVRPLHPNPIAFYSGWDDPAAIRVKATRLQLRPCLDDESGIRPEGSWVQPNLDAVGGGLYGTSGVHTGRRAAFHIAAWYLSRDPAATWPASWPTPATPCGWQWQNTHTEFGVGVDRSWLDDWFGGKDMTQAEFDALCGNSAWIAGLGWRVKALIENTLTVEGGPKDVAGTTNGLRAELDAIKAEIDLLKTGGPIPPGTTFTATTK